MQYLSNIFCYLFFSTIVVFAGFEFWKGIGKGSEARRYHGKFVLIGSMIGYGIPAVCLFPILLADFNATIDTKVFPMVPMFGLLIGWTVGMVVGAFAVVARRKEMEESQLANVSVQEMETKPESLPE